jgi:hypothetical protein
MSLETLIINPDLYTRNILARPVYNPETNEILYPTNTLLTWEVLSNMLAIGVEVVEVV